MKFPLEWLAEYAPSGTTPEDLAYRLTQSGMVVDAVEGSGAETVLEIDVPTNRPDAMNIHGIAREISACTGVPLRPVPSGVAEEGPASAESLTSVSITDGDLCGRYCARIIRGIQVGDTPEWMARRLKSAGLNVLNNIVDVTNYVLWEMGHPLHAFDLARLDQGRIVVRRARAGEKLVTLDGVERTLSAEMLVIADAARPVALAGVIGGSESMISGGTTDLLLESAWFQPLSVRRTSKAMGLSTDASYRFERGADMEAAHRAIDRAAALVIELAGGQVAPGIVDERVEPKAPPRTITLRLGRVATLLGMKISSDRARSALDSLGFIAEPSGDGAAMEVTIPTARQDVGGEADLVEEVGRIVGYEDLPDRDLNLPGLGAIHRHSHRREDEWRSSLLASGFSEVMSIPFVDEGRDGLARQTSRRILKLTNPMAEGQESLRTNLLPGLAHAVRRNHRHGVRDVRIFEVGRVFYGHDGGESHPADGAPGASGQPGVAEPLTCGMAATGLARSRNWSEGGHDLSLHHLKGALEEALERLRIEADFDPLDEAPFRSGTGLALLQNGRRVGRLGEASTSAVKGLDVKGTLLFAEVNLTALFGAPETPPHYQQLGRFPAASRDLALVVPYGVLWADVEAAIRQAGGDLVTRVTVFDRYTGGSMPEGHLSLAVNIVFQRPDRTLEADEVHAAEQTVLESLDKSFKITLRK